MPISRLIPPRLAFATGFFLILTAGASAVGAELDEPSPPAPPTICIPTATRLCLHEGRFTVEVHWWVRSQGLEGNGIAVSLSGETGYFWFFSSGNVELVVKALDGRRVNGAFWIFYGALSDVEYSIFVTDMSTGNVRTYSNPQGRLASVADTDAFR